MDTIEILQRALAGDNEAWDKLFKRLWKVVVGVAASMMKGMDNAAIEDAAQNTFVRLTEDNSRRLRMYDARRGNLEHYIAKIAHNCTIDYLRTNKRHRGAKDLSSIPAPDQKDKNEPGRIFPWELNAAMETLSAREREVFEMLYYDHLDTAEVAERMSIGDDTVRSLKSHGMQKLRKFFDC